MGALRPAPALVESARAATYLLVPVLAVSVASLVGAFLANDFEVAYVAQHSNMAMDRVYTWVAFYAGNEGSLLYIAFALAGLSALAVRLAPASVRDTLPYTNGVLMLVLTFFLAVLLFMADPFAKLSVAPPDGQGINPLLTHPGMFIHPPVMMAGLVSVSIPFAFGLGSLAAGKTGDEVGGPGPHLGHRELGGAGLRAAPGRLVGLHHPGVGRLLGLGPGGRMPGSCPSSASPPSSTPSWSRSGGACFGCGTSSSSTSPSDWPCTACS